MIGRAVRGVANKAEADTDDIESQMVLKRKQTGASAGGVLIKDQGFDGFNSVHDKGAADQEMGAGPGQQRELT